MLLQERMLTLFQELMTHWMHCLEHNGSPLLISLVDIGKSKLNKDDHEKTAFRTPDAYGLFEFMLFNLCNAPATFQRLMDAAFAGVQ